jgi:hypothetical protein
MRVASTTRTPPKGDTAAVTEHPSTVAADPATRLGPACRRAP